MIYLRASLTVDGAPSIEDSKENLASQLHAQFGCSIHVAHVTTELVRSSANLAAFGSCIWSGETRKTNLLTVYILAWIAEVLTAASLT